MKTVSLFGDAVHSGSLILVNRDHPVYGGLCEKRLAPLKGGGFNVRVDERAASILQKLSADLNCDEQIIVSSGYRSNSEQKQIYSDSLYDNGADFTEKYVAVPGCSEHQTGLAVDLALNQPEIDALRPYFPYVGICGDFRERAVKFGFIERYPKGKEDITGIAHEPWHFRFTGAPHSRIMREMGIVLEEYISLLKEFPYGTRPLRYSFDGAPIEISYLAAGKGATFFEVGDNMPYSVSGDNIGGFIITVWKN